VKRIAVIGSRRFKNKYLIENFIEELPQNSIIISGGCKGPDIWAENKAKKLNIAIEIYLPKLDNLKNKYEIIEAYYSRNREIINHCDIVHAFVTSDRKGGTEYTIKYAHKLGKPVFIHFDKPQKKHKLYSHKRSFIGCFSIFSKDKINFPLFKKWKDNSMKYNSMTEHIGNNIIPYITNYYDFITTAPPSVNRDIDNYCCFNLCTYISKKTTIPFVISFKQRDRKNIHGKFASINAEKPILIDGWNYSKKSILFIDDFITSGMTAKTCYEILREHFNHVDGLIYLRW